MHKPPQRIGIPLARDGHSGNLEGEWLPSRGDGFYPLMVSSPTSFNVGLLSATNGVISFVSLMPEPKIDPFLASPALRSLYREKWLASRRAG